MKPLLIAAAAFLWLGPRGLLLAQGSTLFAVEENGPRSERINLVFLSEGYTTADMPNFAAHVNAAVSFLFSKEPWQQYRSYCNVYRIEIASTSKRLRQRRRQRRQRHAEHLFSHGLQHPVGGPVADAGC